MFLVIRLAFSDSSSVPALGETRKLEPWLSGSIEYYNSANVQNYSTEAWKSNTGVIAADNSSNLYKLDLLLGKIIKYGPDRTVLDSNGYPSYEIVADIRR